jgi:hypothetical protein
MERDPLLKAGIAVALLDRLVNHTTTLNIRDDSERFKGRRDTGLPTPNTGAPMT